MLIHAETLRKSGFQLATQNRIAKREQDFAYKFYI